MICSLVVGAGFKNGNHVGDGRVKVFASAIPVRSCDMQRGKHQFVEFGGDAINRLAASNIIGVAFPQIGGNRQGNVVREVGLLRLTQKAGVGLYRADSPCEISSLCYKI